jgi:cell division transport system permease protein
MCRYGVNNFSRNAWLTVAATAVMTITLIIIFVAFASNKVLTDTISQLREQVDMSIYFNADTSEEDGEIIADRALQLESVQSARFITSEENREQFVQDNRDDQAVINATREATNKHPATLRVVVVDINDITELQKFVDEDEVVAEFIDPDREPSFAGERRSTIEGIGNAVGFAQTAGIGASILFIVISSLIIFNTIRMAIFNRREEIQMMKLIGAEKSFIRGPFLVEAMVYGFFAALIATGAGIAALYAVADPLSDFQIEVGQTLSLATQYMGFLLAAMILIGAFIGVISSLLATRRYLKL